jgi:hypothetical protein
VELEQEIALLKRQMAEITEQYHQAIALASAANVRVDGLAAAVAKLEARIDGLRVETKAISEIVG